MGCCGKKNRKPISKVARELQSGEVLLTYTGLKVAPITVPGSITGRHYQFSKRNRTNPVANVDVPGLIAIGIFQE